MVWQIASSEFCRSATRARYWLVLLLTLGYGTLVSGAEADALARGAAVAPGWQLEVAVATQVLWLLVFALPLAVGGSVAQDRSTGLVRLQRVRGVGGAALALGRLGAAGALASLAVGLVMLAMLTVALLALPTGSSVGSAVGFEPRLLDAVPLAWLVLVGVVHVLAATALLAGASLAGWLTAAPRAAELAPVLFVLGLGFAMTGRLSSFNPLERVTFLQLHGVAWTDPRAMIGYWSALTVVLAASTLLVALRKNGV